MLFAATEPSGLGTKSVGIGGILRRYFEGAASIASGLHLFRGVGLLGAGVAEMGDEDSLYGALKARREVSPALLLASCRRKVTSWLSRVGPLTRRLGVSACLLGASASMSCYLGEAGASATAASGQARSLQAPQAGAGATSANWSGYVATGGPFYQASGAFEVPRVSTYLPGSTASEWVGIDGWSSSTVVQAGVNEVPLGPGETLYEPWWEVVPGPQELATGVMVRPGDRVLVSVKKVSAELWSLHLADLSDGDSFTTLQRYGGPATSAEWVVEADTTEQGSPTKLAPLQSRVAFSEATLGGQCLGSLTGLVGSATEGVAGVGKVSITSVAMVQNGEVVSVPSLLSGGSFSVAYLGKAWRGAAHNLR